MTSWADDEFALESAREWLAERFPNEHPAILQTFDIAWVSWECDYQGALITRNGMPEIVIVGEVNAGVKPPIATVREQLAEYRRLIVDTEAALDRYRQLGGTE